MIFIDTDIHYLCQASSCTLGSMRSSVAFYLYETKGSSRCSKKLESIVCARLSIVVTPCVEISTAWIQALNTTLWGGIPCKWRSNAAGDLSNQGECNTVLVAFSSFATAAMVSSKPLTSDVIFPAISLFMLLQFPLAMVTLQCYVIAVTDLISYPGWHYH
jgi:hypothetical protein